MGGAVRPWACSRVALGMAVRMTLQRSTRPALMISAIPVGACRTRSWSSRARWRSVTVTRLGSGSPENDQALSGVRSEPARAASSAGIGEQNKDHRAGRGEEPFPFGLVAEAAGGLGQQGDAGAGGPGASTMLMASGRQPWTHRTAASLAGGGRRGG
jgi:hypothetical protein